MQRVNNEEATEKVKTYPTAPAADGYFFENEDDESMAIHCRIYDNGNKIKRTVLPVSKKEAVVRELTGKDTKEIARFMDKDQDKYTMAAVTIATTIEGVRQPFEIYEQMKLKDYQVLLAINNDLNF